MWMFLGLFAAMAMSSISDMFMAKDARAREDDADDPHAPDAEDQSEQGTAPGPSPGAALIAALDADLTDMTPPDPHAGKTGGDLMDWAAPARGAEAPSDMGLFDDLDERIHSSDLYPPAPPQGEEADDPLQGSGSDDSPTGAGGEPLPQAETPLDMGLFDDLDERIHSSDLYPPARPPEPVFLEGGDGDDLLRGSGANDSLSGGAGNDTLIGAGGNNLLQVDSGNNLLRGGEGDDVLLGGTGNDTLEGGWGDDLLVAGGGDNLLLGGAGNDTLVGAYLNGQGQDLSGSNILNGGAGDDLLIAGQGDILHGGEGSDTFALGDWLAQGAPVTIVDYTAAEDQFVLHYDPARMAAPKVAVSFDPAHPDTAEIRLNGHVIAHVANAPDLCAEDIALVAAHPAVIAQAAE